MKEQILPCPVCGKRHPDHAAGALRIIVVTQGKPADGLTGDEIEVPNVARECLPGLVNLVKTALLPGIREMLGADPREVLTEDEASDHA